MMPYRSPLTDPPPAPPQPSPAAPDPSSPSAVDIIMDYYHRTYRPQFRRGNLVYAGEGREVAMNEATAIPTSELIAKLAGAHDAPRDPQGQVKRPNLPRFFATWAKVAWGDLLKSLPEEETANIGPDEPAAEEFGRLVRESLLTAVTLGRNLRSKAEVVTETERRSLIDWCYRFAEEGPWRSIRSYRCWCKLSPSTEGEVELMVAIRHELLSQVGADRRLRQLGPTKFARRAIKYGLVQRTADDRPHGVRALVLARELVDELTAGLVDCEDEAAEFDTP